MSSFRYAVFSFTGPENYFSYNKLPMPVPSQQSYPKGHPEGSRLSVRFSASNTQNFDSFRGKTSAVDLGMSHNPNPWLGLPLASSIAAPPSQPVEPAGTRRSVSPMQRSFAGTPPGLDPAEAESKQRQIDTLKAQLAASRGTIDDLNAQIRQMIAAQGTASGNEALLQKVQRLSADLEQHKNALNVALNEKGGLEKVAKDNRDRLQEALRTLDSQKKELETLRTERAVAEPASMETRKNLAETVRQVDLLSAKLKNLENEKRLFDPLFADAKRQLADAHAEANSLRLQVQSLEADRQTTGPILDGNKRRLQECFAEIESLKSQVMRLSQERAIREPASDETFRQLQEALAAIAKLKTDLAAAENEKFVQQQAAQDLSRRLASAEHAVRLAQESVTERTVRLENLRQALSDRDQGVGELNGIKEALFKANEDLAFELRKREDRIAILEKELEARTQAQAQFKAEIQDLKATLEKMEVFVEDIPLMEAQIEALTRERDYLGHSLQERTSEAESLLLRLGDAKAALDNRDQKIKSLILENSTAEGLENELTRARAEVGRLREERAGLEARLNEAASAGRDTETAERKARLLNEEVGRLLGESARLPQLVEQNRDLEVQLQMAQARIERFDRLNREKFEDYERNKRLYVARIEELERQLKAHPNTKDIPLEVQELTQGLFEYERRVAQLRTENESLFDRADLLEDALAKHRREAEAGAARPKAGGSDREIARRSFKDPGLPGSARDPREAGALLLAKLQELRDDFEATHDHRALREYEKSLEEYEASKLRSFYATIVSRIDWLAGRLRGLQEAWDERAVDLQRTLDSQAGALRREAEAGDALEERDRERERETAQLKAEQKRLMGYVSLYKTNTEQMELKMKTLIEKLERMRAQNAELQEQNGRMSQRAIAGPQAGDYEDLVAENEELLAELGRLRGVLGRRTGDGGGRQSPPPR